MDPFLDHPLVSVSGQFPLAAPAGVRPDPAAPSPPGRRPWGLRRMGPVRALIAPSSTGWRYDPHRRVAVDRFGRPLLELVGRPGAGTPTAPTTPPLAGTDPPSAEDWCNDFCPDHAVPA